MKRVLVAITVFTFAWAALIGSALAQTTGTATVDLNIRSGPSPEEPVIGLIKARQQANILGCIEGSLWCQVDYQGRIGWAYSQYMSLATGDGTIVVREPAHVAGIPIIPFNSPAYVPGTTIVGHGGTGAAAIGAPTPFVNDVTPPAAVGDYVTSNAMNSFPYAGQVVIGAPIPRDVVLNNVPDYRYQYVYVNDTPVLVDPATRRIVYVFR